MFSDKLPLYIPLDTRAGERLHEEVSAALPGIDISRVHSPVGLSRRWRQPGHGINVAVILVEERYRLQGCCRWRGCLMT